MTDITDAGPRLKSMNDRLQDNTPAAHATPTEGSKQNGCTLTDAEREAVRFCAVVLDMGSRPDCAATLRGLLERLK